jgi:hypothetical protein
LFKELKGLKELDVYGAGVTKGGVEGVQKALPKCKITSK